MIWRGVYLFIMCVMVASSAFVLAEEASGFDDFDAAFFEAFLVVDQECPPLQVEGRCYRHGYSNFFEFQQRFMQAFLGQGREPFFTAPVYDLGLEEEVRWRSTTSSIDREGPEVFQAVFRTRGGERMTIEFSPLGTIYIVLGE